MRVAVLGGGITGVCVALGLSERGVSVDLYEQSDQLITRASYWNEGKIHLGLVYAQDRSRNTAHTMLEGGLRFRSQLSRWIETGVLDRAVSHPFIYAVHRESLVPPAAVEDHFRAVTDHWRTVCENTGTGYITPIEGWIWQPHDAGVAGAGFDDDDIIAAYRTEERAIDTFVVAAHLRSAVATAPRMTVLTNTTVTNVERPNGTDFIVASEHDGRAQRETYGAVVNALWQNRLGIDATIGLAEDRPVLHRFKIGLHSKHSFAPEDLPSVTFVLGEFGDTVNFGHRAYLSWYPAGHLLTSGERVPAAQDSDILGSDLGQAERDTLEALSRLLPAHGEALRRSAGLWEIGGGYITAWGKTGIDDRHSQLHERFEVGVHSTGSYHSVDTGKYTLGPHFAGIVCDRLSPAKTLSRPVRTVQT